MLYVVSYDVSDEKVRTSIAHLLEGFGERVQESVFECQLDGGRYSELCARLVKTLGEPEVGNVRLYQVCADCARAAAGIGAVVKSALSAPCVIS
jgi:CRISPR-associated protein Cas2